MSTTLKLRGGRGAGSGAGFGLGLGGTKIGSDFGSGFFSTASSGTTCAPVPLVSVSSTQILLFVAMLTKG